MTKTTMQEELDRIDTQARLEALRLGQLIPALFESPRTATLALALAAASVAVSSARNMDDARSAYNATFLYAWNLVCRAKDAEDRADALRAANPAGEA